MKKIILYVLILCSSSLLAQNTGTTVTGCTDCVTSKESEEFECEMLEDCKDLINSLIDHPVNLDNDPVNEIQQISISGDVISLSNGGGSATIVHPPAPEVETCEGNFVFANTRTGWIFPWTAVFSNVGNVANTVEDWVNVGGTYTTPGCVTDLVADVDIGRTIVYSRRTRSYVQYDVRLLINGAVVLTQTFEHYLYLDKRNELNPDIIRPQLYEMYDMGSSPMYRANVPANSVIQIQARRRYRTVGAQSSDYFRTIGGLRSNVEFNTHPRINIID